MPVALRAKATDGTVAVYVGCYRLTQVQPAPQELLPFRLIAVSYTHLTLPTILRV